MTMRAFHLGIELEIGWLRSLPAAQRAEVVEEARRDAIKTIAAELYDAQAVSCSVQTPPDDQRVIRLSFDVRVSMPRGHWITATDLCERNGLVVGYQNVPVTATGTVGALLRRAISDHDVERINAIDRVLPPNWTTSATDVFDASMSGAVNISDSVAVHHGDLVSRRPGQEPQRDNPMVGRHGDAFMGIDVVARTMPPAMFDPNLPAGSGYLVSGPPTLVHRVMDQPSTAGVAAHMDDLIRRANATPARALADELSLVEQMRLRQVAQMNADLDPDRE